MRGLEFCELARSLSRPQSQRALGAGDLARPRPLLGRRCAWGSCKTRRSSGASSGRPASSRRAAVAR
eukprot:10229174-Alexandrium_andersonii.AAC.1